ncbi:hypothetical protein SALBM135S_03678 [Streptomyces alboniger]
MRLALFDKGRLGIVDDGAITDVTDQVAPHSAGPAGVLQQYVDGVRRRGAGTRPGARTPGAAGGGDTGGTAAPPWQNHRRSGQLPRPQGRDGLPHVHRRPRCLPEGELVGHRPGPGRRPTLLRIRTDPEGELAVVIGRTASQVSADDALDHVFGYTCLLDITVRSGEDRSTRKSFDTFTPIGQWIVTADEIEDTDRLGLRCDVAGETRQDTNTGYLIFGVRELVAYASSVMTLYPGDVIATGTPAGVGPLSDGDRVVVEIEKVGRLEVGVDGSRAKPYASRPGHRRS